MTRPEPTWLTLLLYLFVPSHVDDVKAYGGFLPELPQGADGSDDDGGGVVKGSQRRQRRWCTLQKLLPAIVTWLLLANEGGVAIRLVANCHVQVIRSPITSQQRSGFRSSAAPYQFHLSRRCHGLTEVRRGKVRWQPKCLFS